jgi:hypothetical protein
VHYIRLAAIIKDGKQSMIAVAFSKQASKAPRRKKSRIE